MIAKAKGTNAERELIKLFWEGGWAAIRAAGSGSTHFPCPDILAGNGTRRMAIEVKVTKDNKKYFSKEEVKQLLNFASYFGAEAWIAIRFSKRAWVFVHPEDLDETGKGLVFSCEDIEKKGLSFLELAEKII